MKRVISLLMVVVLLFSFSNVSNATIAGKLQGHWGNNLINRSFLGTYFSYLAKNNFNQFNPEGSLTEKEFTSSLASLFKDYGYSTSISGSNSPVLRSRMAYLIRNELSKAGINNNNIGLPFKDIGSMSKENTDALKTLYNNKIIVGDTNSNFNPNKNLTQVEAIVVLQRVKGVLESMNKIAFKTLGIVQSYNNQEELIIKEEEARVLLTITKEFPTPGYTMTVDKIMREGDNYRIYFNIVKPKADMILPQVIAYKTLTLEIDKDLLCEAPYNFILDGYNSTIAN